MNQIPLMDMMKLSLNLPSVLFKVSAGGKEYVGKIESIDVGDKGIETAKFHFQHYLMQPEFAPIELLPDQYEIIEIIDTKVPPAGKVLVDLLETENKLKELHGSSNLFLNQYFKELKDGFEKLRKYHPELKLRNAINYINEIIQETEFRIILDDMKQEETLNINFHQNEYIYSIVSLVKQF